MYFQKVEDNKKINVDLMMAADKFLIKGLLDLCTKFLESNLSVENALEVLIKAELRGVIGTLSTILQQSIALQTLWKEFFTKKGSEKAHWIWFFIVCNCRIFDIWILLKLKSSLKMLPKLLMKTLIKNVGHWK